MNEILQHYDAERIAEFADEGDPRIQDEAPMCVERGCDEPVEFEGEACALCRSEEAAAIDQESMRLLVVAAATVEIKCALHEIERAIRHIARGRYHLPRVASRVIDVLTEAA